MSNNVWMILRLHATSWSNTLSARLMRYMEEGGIAIEEAELVRYFEARVCCWVVWFVTCDNVCEILRHSSLTQTESTRSTRSKSASKTQRQISGYGDQESPFTAPKTTAAKQNTNSSRSPHARAHFPKWIWVRAQNELAAHYKMSICMFHIRRNILRTDREGRQPKSRRGSHVLLGDDRGVPDQQQPGQENLQGGVLLVLEEAGAGHRSRSIFECSTSPGTF